MSGYRTPGVVGVVACLVLGSIALAGDAVTDAKRKAANDLMKEGKTNDAIAMIGEVIKVDPENYRDHLLLARAYDKLNKSQEAVEEYRRMLELPGGSEDRAAKLEAERRLKVLDAQTAKIAALEEEMLKKLEVLEREAIAARDMRAVEHVFRLKAGVWAAQNRKDAAGTEVLAGGEWQSSSLSVRPGVTYHIRAAGHWMIDGLNPCSGDGLRNLPRIVGGPKGALIVASSGDMSRYQLVGSDSRFTPTVAGKLTFICNMPTQIERTKNTGKIFVVIQQE